MDSNASLLPDPQPADEVAAEARRALGDVLVQAKRVVVGQDAMLERVLVALLAGGHVLLEGVPGLAKTLTVRTLSDALGGRFSRVQFTPDLVPADLVGTRIWQPDTGQLRTELGPVFANLLLADEVNRAPAKVQSALLEVERVPDELLVGAVGYASTVTTALEPTTDHAAVERSVDRLQADGGTSTGDALMAALDRLEGRKAADGGVAPAAIVLLSDGKTTEGSDPLRAARRASELGIPVYTVALGTLDGTITAPDGQVLPVPPDPQTMAAIAERSGGVAFEVGDAGELDRVYERLGSRIGTRTERQDVSAGFAAGGLVLLLGGLGVGLRGRARLV